jgi:tetratricopeptide (TPR) repeat protein
MQQKCNATCAKAADIGAAVQALTAALAGAPSARLETRPSLLFASAAGGDRAYLDAVSLINDGRYEAALASLEAARTAFGPHPDILTYMGYANRKLGRYDVAERYYKAALAASPGHRAASEYYGELLVERGDKAGAERMLASLDSGCTFGCAEADELRRWVEAGHARRRAERGPLPVAPCSPPPTPAGRADPRGALAGAASLERALSAEPAECLVEPAGAEARRSVAIGRIAFRAPLLLGGQAARAGMSCATCHRNGRGNPDFLFPGPVGTRPEPPTSPPR